MTEEKENIIYKTEYKDIDSRIPLATLIGDLKVRLEQGYTQWVIANKGYDDDPIYVLRVLRLRPENDEEKQARQNLEHAAYEHIKKKYFELKQKYEPD